MDQSTLVPLEKESDHYESPSTNLKTFQIRALMRKNASLKSRQPVSICCHLCCPCTLICIVGLVGLIISAVITGNTLNVKPDPQTLWGANDQGYECLDWLYFVNAEGSSAGQLSSSGAASGMLGHLADLQQQCFVDSANVFSPYFVQMDSAKDVDDAIYAVESQLRNSTNNEINSADTDKLADGAVIFNTLNFTSLDLDYTIQWPDTSDSVYMYLTSFTRNNQISVNYISVIMNMIDSAYMSAVSGGALKYLNVTLQGFPYKFSLESVKQGAQNTLGALAYPFAFSLLAPTYIHAIVLEKQEKLRELMKMMGLVMFKYWFVTFIFDFLLYGILSVFVLILGAIWQLNFFLNPSVLIFLLFTWGITQIGLAFLVSTFMSKNRTITAFLLYLVVILGVIVGFGLNMYYGADSDMPAFLKIYPPFAFYRGMYLLAQKCGTGKCYNLGDVPAGSELNGVFGYLWIQNIILYLLVFYLDNVLPQEFGIRKHPLFFILEPLAWWKGRKAVVEEDSHFTELEVEGAPEDDDVKAERKAIDSGKVKNKPIIIHNLYKKFDNKKVAVDRLTLSINPNETFGLLGPNGAGKTTTISMLTGLFPPTSGTATISGYDIVKEIDQVHLVIGICPQFDVHWPTMTVEEHLLFYARMKGIPSQEETSHVHEMAARVGLEGDMKKKSSELSGGMRRRLSVAIAFIGNPQIVFLDEPSSGLDPTSRRHLWEVIDHYKKGRSIILTTHSMEEADTLCTRIGIIAKGRLQCLGSPIHLKNKFGKGYSLYINFKRDGIDVGSNYIDKLLNGKYEIVNSVGTYRIYRTDKGSVKVSNLLREMELNKDKYGIEDWGLSQTSLEEVFLSICREQESDDEPKK